MIQVDGAEAAVAAAEAAVIVIIASAVEIIVVHGFKIIADIASKVINSVDHISWHWERCPAVANNAFSGLQAEEMISSLQTASGTEGNCSDCPRYHGVIMNLVGLHVSAKL